MAPDDSSSWRFVLLECLARLSADLQTWRDFLEPIACRPGTSAQASFGQDWQARLTEHHRERALQQKDQLPVAVQVQENSTFPALLETRCVRFVLTAKRGLDPSSLHVRRHDFGLAAPHLRPRFRRPLPPCLRMWPLPMILTFLPRAIRASYLRPLL